MYDHVHLIIVNNQVTSFAKEHIRTDKERIPVCRYDEEDFLYFVSRQL